MDATLHRLVLLFTEGLKAIRNSFWGGGSLIAMLVVYRNSDSMQGDYIHDSPDN